MIQVERPSFDLRRRQLGVLSHFLVGPNPLDAAVGEAHDVLYPVAIQGRVHPEVAVERPFDIAIEPESASAFVAHQAAVTGDGVGAEEALQILGLELQILVAGFGQRVFAVDGIEQTHVASSAWILPHRGVGALPG